MTKEQLEQVRELAKSFVKDESGATAVEYGLMVALIAGAIVVTVDQLGDRLNTVFESVRDKLPQPAPAGGGQG